MHVALSVCILRQVWHQKVRINTIVLLNNTEPCAIGISVLSKTREITWDAWNSPDNRHSTQKDQLINRPFPRLQRSANRVGALSEDPCGTTCLQSMISIYCHIQFYTTLFFLLNQKYFGNLKEGFDENAYGNSYQPSKFQQ